MGASVGGGDAMFCIRGSSVSRGIFDARGMGSFMNNLSLGSVVVLSVSSFFSKSSTGGGLDALPWFFLALIGGLALWVCQAFVLPCPGVP